jgi:hypothetical protein
MAHVPTAHAIQIVVMMADKGVDMIKSGEGMWIVMITMTTVNDGSVSQPRQGVKMRGEQRGDVDEQKNMLLKNMLLIEHTSQNKLKLSGSVQRKETRNNSNT